MAAIPRPRPAHPPGPTDLSYTRNGRRLVTVGCNDTIRVFLTGSLDEPSNIDYTCENNLTVVAANDFFVVGSEDGRVSKYSLENDLFDSVLVRCSLPIRHLALSPSMEWLAVASDELVIKVVNTLDMDRVLYLREQEKPIKHLAYDPTGAYMAATSTDGVIHFYAMDSEQPHVAHKIPGLVRAVETDDESCTAAVWHPDGRAFAVATPTRDIQIVSMNDWTHQRAFKGGHADDITAIAWSPSGSMLVTASRDRTVNLWETRSQKIIRTLKPNFPVLAFQWHPTENLLSYATNEGEIIIHNDFVPEKDAALLGGRLHPAPFLADPLGEISGNARGSGRAERQKDAPQNRPRADTPNSIDEMLASVDGSDDGFIEDDDGAGYVNGLGKRVREPDAEGNHPRKRQARQWQPSIHESFQPGSTPWRGDRKYLCLNLIGLVWTIQYEQYCTITVEYYDRSFQRDFHFTDPYFYEEACMSENGILLASHSRNDQRASIYFRPHEHWTTERPDWRITLPEDEDVVAIALSESFVVVSTSADYLRVYTLAGTPYRVLRQKSSPTVTCASWRDYVMAIGNGAVGSDGRTRLQYSIINVKRDEVCQSDDAVSMPANAQLRSVFFSDGGDPYVFDTTGTLLTLLHWRTPGQAQWVPMLDTKRLQRLANGKRFESYWPVAVADGKFHCVILKGGDLHPYFPRPLLSEFDFEIPFVSAASEQEKADGDEAEPENKLKGLEQAYLRDSTIHGLHADLVEATHASSAQRAELSRQELELDKTLLQMVWECCAGGDERLGVRALELVTLMKDRSGKMLEGASKIATRFGMDVLRGKMAEVAERRLVGIDEV